MPILPSSVIFVPPKNPSPNLQTVLKYVQGRNQIDAEKMMDCMHDSLEHRILPKSMGRPILNKKQYDDYLHGLLPLFKTYKMVIHEVIETEETITLHASVSARSVTDSTFMNEYIIIFRFAPGENGELPKISLVKEFVDSAQTSQFFAEEREKSSRGIARSH